MLRRQYGGGWTSLLVVWFNAVDTANRNLNLNRFRNVILNDLKLQEFHCDAVPHPRPASSSSRLLILMREVRCTEQFILSAVGMWLEPVRSVADAGIWH